MADDFSGGGFDGGGGGYDSVQVDTGYVDGGTTADFGGGTDVIGGGFDYGLGIGLGMGYGAGYYGPGYGYGGGYFGPGYMYNYGPHGGYGRRRWCFIVAVTILSFGFVIALVFAAAGDLRGGSSARVCVKCRYGISCSTLYPCRNCRHGCQTWVYT